MDLGLRDKHISDYFPLKTVGDVLKLFEYELSKQEPNLAILSIIAGEIENSMTNCRPLVKDENSGDLEKCVDSINQNNVLEKDTECDVTNTNLVIDPILHWDLVHALYQKFESIIKSCCDINILQAARTSKQDPEKSNERSKSVRALVKHVADIVWNTLSKSQYKDRPHLQSIYSYLTGNKLDCFGVAYAVVAACQLLELNEVHLALSEDHAWVVFGNDGEETAEVTWHGKGSEDKRGQPVEISKARSSWLYVAGQPVVCDRYMETAALVNAINPAINATTDSLEVGELQKELLWLLYDKGHLKTFPMAIGNLADLEEISPSLGRPHCTKLYEEAIIVNKKLFDNHHVYPYTYQGGYFYRAKKFKEAIESWSNAADVIRLYKYSKDDEEIYKEFMEIANELIPHVMKAEATSNKSLDHSVLNDPYSFGQLIRFYDGICCWEEGSPTPVLHIGWAKPMVASFSKFDAGVRNQMKFSGPTKSENDDQEEEEDLDEGKSSSPSFYNLNSHENVSCVDTDDNNSLQNESFHSASSDEGICLLTSKSNGNNKDDSINFLCASNGSNVPEYIETKSNIKRTEDSDEIAINNNYYDKYSATKSSSTSAATCDTKLHLSLNSSFTSSSFDNSVKSKPKSTTSPVINTKVNKNALPSNKQNVCDSFDHLQSRNLNHNHRKRKYSENSTYHSQEYYYNGVQNRCQNDMIGYSPNCDLNRCESCDIKFSSSNVNGLDCNCQKETYEANERVVSRLSGVCGSKLLSVGYLLGFSDAPFVDDNPNQENFSVSELLLKRKHNHLTAKPMSTVLISDGDSNSRSSSEKSFKKMELQSAKMIGLKELLCSEKINTSAIQLQLTAQSQTESKKSMNFGNNLTNLSDESLYLMSSSNRPKRSRRE